MLFSCAFAEPMTLMAPRGVEYNASGDGGTWAALSMEADPVTLTPTPGRTLGTRVDWARATVAVPFQAESTVLSSGITLQGQHGPRLDVFAEYQAEITVFETAVAPGHMWQPESDGYRVLYHTVVGHRP